MERKNRHSVYDLEYHLVVCTKFRRPVIRGDLKERLIDLTYTLFDKYGGFVNAVETDEDHVHIMFETPPQVCLSQMINNYKCVTSRRLRKEFEGFLKPFFYEPLFWSDSYFICTASERSRDAVKKYIQNQGKEKTAIPVQIKD